MILRLRLIVAMLIVCGLWPAMTLAAVTVSGTTTSDAATAGSSLTIAKTIPAGDDRLLAVCVGWGTTQTVSTVTFNGVSLTRLGGATHTNGVSADLWYLVNPTVTTANVVITMTGAVNYTLTGGAISFTGVNTSSPFDTASTTFGDVNPGGQPSLTITSTTSDLVIDCLASNDSTLTAGGGQTQYYQTGSSPMNGAASTEPGATSTTMSWSGIADFFSFAYLAVNINQASGTPPITTDLMGAGSTQAGSDGGVMSWSWTQSDEWALAAVSIRAAATTPTPSPGGTRPAVPDRPILSHRPSVGTRQAVSDRPSLQ